MDIQVFKDTWARNLTGFSYIQLLEHIQTKKVESGICIEMVGGEAHLSYGKQAECMRGISLIAQAIHRGEINYHRQEQAAFTDLTYMLDCSRNAVANMDFLKQLIFSLSLMGYTRLMLYTEDTYTIEKEPYFGHMRGRFSQQELKELDAFALAHGIEITPCIQTLAHLNAIFQWQVYEAVHDVTDILLAEEEKTYILIEKMIASLSTCLTSRTINIGMDEAHMIGQGKYLKKHGYKKQFDIMKVHLERVVEICRKYGFSCMMWSDMFFRLLTGGQYYSENVCVSEEILAGIPKDIGLIYWDYYHREKEVYDRMIKNHILMSEKIIFAGGAWKWSGYAPLINHSLEASRIALAACKEHGIRDIIVTGWGDDGAEAAQASVYPVLTLYAESCYTNKESDAWVRERMYATTLGNFENFLLMDLPNLVPDNLDPDRKSIVGAAPAKYLLYADVLLGIFDRHIDIDTYPVFFEESAKKLELALEAGGMYAYALESMATLCRLLACKVGIGIHVREAYLKKDRSVCKDLVLEFERAIFLTEQFHRCIKVQWERENKVLGYEVIDIRLAGVKQRLVSGKERLSRWIEGEISHIEELEEERLPYVEGQKVLTETMWTKIVTPAVVQM